MNPTIIEQLNAETEDLSASESLRWIAQLYGKEASFSLGFGLEGMVIADLIFTQDLDIRVFTLDTGRLFVETYELFNKVYARYQKKIEVYFPERDDVENLVSSKGPFSFYESIENRKECCGIRKLRPLERALKGTKIWITGLRASQSEFRSGLSRFYWDEKRQLIKFNPLFEWSREEVWEYIRKNRVPYNALHDRGYQSVGCAPCTRATEAGEDERAGRWWWEDSHKECGLHEIETSSPLKEKPKALCQKC